MLKNIKNRLWQRKNSKLNLTPGESVRNEIIKTGIETAKASGYAAGNTTGNTTEKLVEVASNIGNGIDLGTQLAGGGESASSLGKIAFQATKDVARGDALCTGLCAVSGRCETIALACSTIKIIPYRGRIYVSAKILSKGCMSYRNLCAGEGC